MTVSRYSSEMFSHPVQSREKRELDRGKRATALQKIRISVPRFPKPSRNNLRGRYIRQHACAWDEAGVGETYIWQIQRVPSCLPSLLTLMAQGPHTGYYYFHSFPHVCLSVGLSVHPYIRSVLPFHVCLFCLAARLLPHRGNLFSDAFEDSPEASLFPPPHTRDGALSFLRATRDGKSSRPPLLLGRYPSCATFCEILVEIFKDGKEHLHYNYVL